MTADSVPQIRTDIITNRRVIVAPGRQGRPHAVSDKTMTEREFDPFLQGNESETPSERYAVRTDGSHRDQPGWLLRSVPNRFPIVRESGAGGMEASSELFPAEESVGIHDVVIECPDGRSRLRDLTPEELRRVLAAWQVRARDLLQHEQIADVVVFRNEGFNAGASLPHCHSQIVGFAGENPGFAMRRKAVAQWKSVRGGDLTQDWLAAEKSAASRVVETADGFTVVCPFAPRTNYHMRIVADQPAPRFEQLTDQEVTTLSDMLFRSLERLDALLPECSFNILLPICGLRHEVQFPWMVEIVPRLTRYAGWELLTDIDIVTVSPESSAAQLRHAADAE